MNIKSIFVILVLVLLSAGCIVKGPSVKLKAPSVEVGLENGGTHCPPGQAKKGRC